MGAEILQLVGFHILILSVFWCLQLHESSNSKIRLCGCC